MLKLFHDSINPFLQDRTKTPLFNNKKDYNPKANAVWQNQQWVVMVALPFLKTDDIMLALT